jgi:RNA polymerase sigma factor (sigma-70 family)
VHPDDDAYGRWLAELRPQLLRYARQQLGGDRAEAEDVVQDASMRALVALRDGRVPANPRAWMYVIVRNRCHDVRGARRPSQPLEDAFDVSSPAPSPDEEAAARRQLGAVVDAIGALPDAQRRALVSATFEGRAYEEIAVREATSVQAVKSLVHRARRGLEASGARAAALMPFGLREQITGFFAQHTATAASVAAVAVAVPVVPLEAPFSPPPPRTAKAAAKRATPVRASAVSAARAVPPAAATQVSARRAVAAAVAERRARAAACASRAASDAEYGGGCSPSGGSAGP